MYQALYRARRPEVFSEVLGQEHIIKILKHQVATGSVSHAYLFTGTRGTGKTTMARLLAKALNCTGEGERPCGICESCRAIAAGNFIDVVEMDAASNNSVDDIRSLREEVNFPPVAGRTKVYIIDEVHMLSTQAFNAFLKTLEEPPASTVFILCTTDPNKLPATILSRCIRLDFRRVPEKTIKDLFRRICEKINVQADEDALSLLATNADGSVRDGLSLLDRCASAGNRLTRNDVLFLLGVAGSDTYLKITRQVLSKDAAGALTTFSEALSEGKEVLQFTRDWVEHFRDLMIIKNTERPEDILNLSMENIARLKAQADAAGMDSISACIRRLSQALADARWAAKPRILIELAIIEMCS